jgi:hypothetical protein
MSLTTPWGVDAFTADNWDGLRPKDPINVVLTGPVAAIPAALDLFRETVGWDWCLGGDQYVCQLQPVNAHRNDDQVASRSTTFAFVDRDHVRVYLTDAWEPTGRILVSPVHRDRWTGLRRWTQTRGGVPLPAWEVADSFDEPRARIEEGAHRRRLKTSWRWLGNRMAVTQANGRARASDGWVLVVGGP